MNGTRHSTLEEVDRWRVNLDAPQVLWLSGVAGVGKSTVARELVDKWKLDGHLAGSFFFSRDAEETRVSRLFFTTIAQQGLSRLNSQVRTVVADGVRKLFDPLSATLEEQCLLLFVKPVKVVNEPIVLVLEAMDECEPGACEQLLRIILPELFNLPYLKLLITSRPEAHIQRQLAPYEPQEVSLGLGDGSNTQDVEIYMRRRLPKATLSENQILQLIERASGLFIWAKTVCDLVENLRGDRDTFINRVLSQNLRQINSIYRIALEQAIGRNDEEENVLAYMDILRLITAAYEPLSPNTINQLLGISNSMVIVNDLRSLLECHGPDEVIRFLHPTFRDFLCKSPDIGLYRVDINEAHALIGIRCLTTILDELHYDICRLFDHRDQVFKPEALQVLCIQRTSAALRYSCNSWGNHFASQINGGYKGHDFMAHIESFFRRSLLDWLYMIGVQGSIDNAFSVFRGFIAANISENIVQWSMDTTRFLKLHWNTIRQNPYQVYRIFALCPLSSIFQQVYAKSTSFPHPTVTIGVELDWPSTMTIQTYDIQVSILLLPDDLLATGGQREAMPVFSVWDMKTTDGITSTHPCGTRHCTVTHLSFTNSGDSSLLHTGCNCGKLCKWKVSPYSCSVLSQVSLERNGICIAWADDGTKAITFSITEQIGCKKQGRKYYCNTYTDAGPSTRHEILEDQNRGDEKDDVTDRKTWIRFTPCSGDRFVHWIPGVSKDKLAIFDSSSGRLISRKSYPHALKEIHFSPDGRNILLWLGLPGQLELMSSKDGSDSWKWTLEDGFIKSVRFFPNTTRILLLSTSATYIIDSFDGSTLYKRDAGEAVFPCCSIISPNGERIASHSRGKIQIMDHALGEYTTEYLAEEMGHILHFSWAHKTLIFMEDHYDGRSSLSFQRLSSNIPTIEPVRNANSYISSSFLSPNGHFLLTVHHDDSLGLWNTTSGIKLPITGNDGKGVFRNHRIQWAQDSSTALIWSPNHLTSLRTDSGQMQIIPLPVTIALVPPSPASPLLACSFFSTSNQILSIQSDGYTTKLLLDKSISLSICRLLSPPESIYELLVSPNGQSAALICERELLVLNLSDGSCQHPLGQGKFSGAGFSPDGTHLCVVESLAYLNTVFIIWHIEMSSLSIRKCHVQLQPTWHSPKLRSVSSLTSGNRSILSTLTSRSLSKGVTSCFFDCADGKQIIPSFVCYEDGHLRYGTHSLMEPYFPDDAVSCISENGIAYIEKGRMVVVDYSLLISQM
ncbi:hypothetical protein CPB86DRAFT_57754 [Serendipita vermifera]|nr:hypothetical protein CPB86DRAFT_57754 [Serendipita vermifera]